MALCIVGVYGSSCDTNELGMYLMIIFSNDVLSFGGLASILGRRWSALEAFSHFAFLLSVQASSCGIRRSSLLVSVCHEAVLLRWAVERLPYSRDVHRSCGSSTMLLSIKRSRTYSLCRSSLCDHDASGTRWIAHRVPCHRDSSSYL